MISNIRYIKTKVDETPKTLLMHSCNLCPYLFFIKELNTAKCMQFKSPNSENLIERQLYSYNVAGDKAIPVKNIIIPEWCGLVKELMSTYSDRKLIIRNGCNGYRTIYGVFDSTNLISSSYVSYDRTLDKLVSAETKYGTNLPVVQNRTVIPAFSIVTPPPPPLTHKCSCCGNVKEGVNRIKNIGMCTECWEQNKDNETVKQFAFVNNFRLKRNSTWTDVIHKKINKI